MVEQSASSRLRQRRWYRLVAARTRYGLECAIEVDCVHRIWVRILRSIDQSAERILRSEKYGKLHGVLVDLGSEQGVADGYWPRRDGLLQTLALQAIHEYWVTDGNNETSAGGVPMVQTAFMSAWNWDARPFPVFPALSNVWGDAGNWRAGQWIDGKGPFLTPLVPDGPPAPGPYATFPVVPTLGWSVRYSPIFSTTSAPHVSGRESRAAKFVSALWEIELNYDVLRMTSPNTELQQIIGFFETCGGEGASFYFEPPTLSPITA